MKKCHLLQKLSSLGVAAFGAISVISIVTAPARAFTLNSTLEWDDATSDFWDGVDLTDENNVFSVTFTPANLGGEAAVFIATGNFSPFFPDLPNFFPINGGNGVTGTFANIGQDSPGFGLPDLPASEAYYELTNDLEFDFGNEVSATLSSGAIFVGIQEPDTSYEFDLEGGAGDSSEWEFSIPGMNKTATFSNFEFGDLPPLDGGDFATEGFVEGDGGPTVPEPASILGLLTICGLGLGLKRKKELLRIG